ncbi:hypothetical protein GCM10020255_109870 [Rhodococcus baikonurensis]
MSVVLTDFADGVAVITLNRPEAKNAVNLDLAKALAAAIDEFEERSDLTIGILTGAGGTFCAGMDLKGFARGERPSLPGRGFAGLTEAPPSKPLIAAVEGWALAGGCELALAADLIVASTDAKFGLPEVKRGLPRRPADSYVCRKFSRTSWPWKSRSRGIRSVPPWRIIMAWSIGSPNRGRR